ncbi:MAG: hypothetical protein ACRCZQ_05265, partial [Bacteroidales bacterium]
LGTVDNPGGTGTFGDPFESTAIAANENCRFVGWYVGKEPVVAGEDITITGNTLKVKLTAETGGRTYTAKFISQYTIAFESSDETLGTVDNPGGTEDSGTFLESTATANENCDFDGWFEGDNQITATTGDIFVSNNGLKLNVKSSLEVNTKTYTAQFTARKYTVNFTTSGPGGSIGTTSSTDVAGNTLSCTAEIGSDYDGVTWYDADGLAIIEIDDTKDIYVKEKSLYIKSSSSVHNKTFTARFGKCAPRISYNGSQLVSTRDPKDYGVFFQFGSVLAWSATDYDPTVAWNVTDLLPNWNNSWSVGNENFPDQTLTNVKAGKGDPCKLVGLSKTQISGGTVDNGTWRTPSKAEYEDFAFRRSNLTAMNGVKGRYFGSDSSEFGTGGEFLPAVGYRIITDGTIRSQGELGYYLSRTIPISGQGVSIGYRLRFSKDNVSLDYSDQAYAFSVRCVPQ